MNRFTMQRQIKLPVILVVVTLILNTIGGISASCQCNVIEITKCQSSNCGCESPVESPDCTDTCPCTLFCCESNHLDEELHAIITQIKDSNGTNMDAALGIQENPDATLADHERVPRDLLSVVNQADGRNSFQVNCVFLI